MLLTFAISSWSATYYVDFDGGDDSANGTSTSTPWRTLPGTTSGGNTQSIAVGDTIYLKPGTTYDSSDPGEYISIASFYYAQPANAGQAITIQIYDDWPTATGDVVIDGTGVTVAQYHGLLEIVQRNYIHILGTDTNNLIIQDSPRNGFQSGGTSGSHQTGILLQYMQFNTSSGFSGCDLYYSDNWEIRDCYAGYNQYKGFSLGQDADYNCDGGKYYDSTAEYNGQAATEDCSCHGFGLYAATNVEYWRCTSNNNYRDGFDFGTAAADNSNYASSIVINSTAYSNGEAGFAANGVATAYAANIGKHYYLNNVSYNNNDGWQVYDGVNVYIFNCILDSNSTGIEAFRDTGYAAVLLTVKNTIFKGSTSREYGGYNTEDVTTDLDYNLYERGGTYNNFVSNWEGVYNRAWTSGALAAWQGQSDGDGPNSHDSVDDGWLSDWIDPTGHTDWHLTVGSSCIDTGVDLTSVWPIGISTADRDGNARTGTWDIGPYEYIIPHIRGISTQGVTIQ